MGKHKEAADCYRKGLELDPSNENYKSNLTREEECLRNCPPAGGGMPSLAGIDLGSIMSNPMMQNFASQMMQSSNAEELQVLLFTFRLVLPVSLCVRCSVGVLCVTLKTTVMSGGRLEEVNGERPSDFAS